MSAIPGKASSSWINEYRNPSSGPNRPGKDGGSVADPVGNCPRCGRTVHHEEQHEHNSKVHLGL